jgi:hypothetical protein
MAKSKDIQPLVTYPPEIESRRADYKRLAESIITMQSLQSDQSYSLLDVEPPGVLTDDPRPDILWKAFEGHLWALFECVSQVYEDDFLRTIYVELRLYYDTQMLRLESGQFSHRKKDRSE